jgi:ethanolamine utilization protein EutA
VTPASTLPLRSVPAITPDLPLEADELSSNDIAAAIRASLRKLDLHEGEQPVALCYRWQGSATWQRLDDFCAGVVQGLDAVLAKGHPLVLVGDSDVGGLVGIHAHEEAKLKSAIVSIDGVNLKEFDFVDIGAMLPASGAVPVVIKSLVFPATSALGKTPA